MRLNYAAALVAFSSLAFGGYPSGFSEVPFVTGFTSPTAMAFAPDGRLFICQQGGTLRVVKNGVLLANPFLTVAVDSNGERGLLGVAFHPDFANNNFVYIYYTVATSPIHNRVSRVTANGDVMAAGSEVPILDLDNLSGATNHNGGAIHFGSDGKLYVAVGDNANSGNAQSFSTRLGKILRLNDDGTIPADNPFFATATGLNRSIWALGLRNPFTFSFHPGNGRMHINDVGQSTWEEVDPGSAGANYGWPIYEGFDSGDPNYVDPLIAYNHNSGTPTGCAITGGAFYTGTKYPAAYADSYFYADFCSQFIYRIAPPNYNTQIPFATALSKSAVDLQVFNGELYYLTRDNGGGVYVVTTALSSVNVTVNSVPAGLLFSASGAGCAPGSGYVTPVTLSWIPGSSCTLTFGTPQTGSGNVQVNFHHWDDGSTNAARNITAPASAVAYTATFVPAGLTVTPGSGSGSVQTFAGIFVDGTGYQNLQWIQMLFAVSTNGGGQGFCYVHYDVQGNKFWLFSDTRGFFVGPVAPGTPSSLLQGALCALNTSASSVSASGTQLTVNANVLFKQALSLNVYLRWYTLAGGDSGWVQQGAWTAAPAALGTMTVSPSSGSLTNGTQQLFTLTYPDTPGFAGAATGWEQFLVAVASNGGGQPYCFIHYDRAANGLWMFSSDVGYFLGPVTPGVSSSLLTSSACSVNTASATAANNSGGLVLTVPVTLKSPMIGAQKLFQRSLTVLNVDTGFVQSGTLTVQ